MYRYRRALRRFSLSLGPVTGVLCVLLLVLLGALPSPAEAKAPALPEPDAIEQLVKREIEAFRAAMQSGDFATLHAHGSKSFRDTVKREDVDKALRPMVGAFEPLALVGPLKPQYSEPPHIDEDGKLILRGQFEAPGRIIRFTIDMVMEEGAWRFLNLNVKHDSPPQEDGPVTVIPEDQRLPMPPPDRIVELIRAHLVKYSEAMKTGDFQHLHTLAARSVREKSPVEEMRKAMQPLVGKFGVLETIGGLEPKFFEVPRIDDNGRLFLRGYFDTAPLKSRFTLDLIPEDREWRYENINVNIAETMPPPLPDDAAIESLIKREVEAFRAAMQSGDFATLHAHGSKAFRDTVKLEDVDKALRPMVGGFEPLGLVAPLKPRFSQSPRIGDDGKLVLRGDFDATSRIVTFEIDMVMDGNDWRFIKINVQHDTPKKDPAPREPVPADQRLPMPPPEVVEQLVRSHVTLFSDALKSGNFKELHAKGARSAREAMTPEKMADIMGPLIGKFGALETIGGLAPQYTEPPHIDDTGRLLLKGHFETAPLKSRFTIELIPEDGAWRYEDINVKVE